MSAPEMSHLSQPWSTRSRKSALPFLFSLCLLAVSIMDVNCPFNVIKHLVNKLCPFTVWQMLFCVAAFQWDHKQKYYWGHKEILIPVYKNMSDAMKKHPDVDVLINFASLRSAFDSTMETMQYPQVNAPSSCTICKVLNSWNYLKMVLRISLSIQLLPDSHHCHHCWGNPWSPHQEDHQGRRWEGSYNHWTRHR